jgi:hypothetical protein
MLLESKDEPGEFPSLRRNTLVVTELSRADLNAVFDCQASNNNISQPVSTSVAIEMHRKYVVNRATVACGHFLRSKSVPSVSRRAGVSSPGNAYDFPILPPPPPPASSSPKKKEKKRKPE